MTEDQVKDIRNKALFKAHTAAARRDGLIDDTGDFKGGRSACIDHFGNLGVSQEDAGKLYDYILESK